MMMTGMAVTGMAVTVTVKTGMKNGNEEWE